MKANPDRFRNAFRHIEEHDATVRYCFVCDCMSTAGEICLSCLSIVRGAGIGVGDSKILDTSGRGRSAPVSVRIAIWNGMWWALSWSIQRRAQDAASLHPTDELIEPRIAGRALRPEIETVPALIVDVQFRGHSRGAPADKGANAVFG